MRKKATGPIYPPSATVVQSTKALIGYAPRWRQILKPILDKAVAEMRREGVIPSEIHQAFNDFGGYCRTLSKEMRIENRKRAWAAKEAARTATSDNA